MISSLTNMPHPETKTRLIFRLSSLGDVILAASALEATQNRGLPMADWVVAREYAEVLQGHPGISKLWVFDRATGFRGWVELCRTLWQQGYDEILDLHSSLRTRLARLLFLWFRLTHSQSSRHAARWRVIRKERIRLLGLYMFKRLWPRAFHPTPRVSLFARAGGGSGQERPKLAHLISSSDLGIPFAPGRYLCVMPDSRWGSKRWGVEKFFAVIRDSGLAAVVLGSATDQASRELVERLAKASVPHISAVGIWSLRQAASALSRAQAYLGNDTGLGHLSEAVGTPAIVIFGPTTPEMGFGPWRAQSRPLGISLWCRPCGKDGRCCYRLTSRYECLHGLPPKRALDALLAANVGDG